MDLRHIRFGAVHSFIFKIAFAAYLLVFWALHLEQFHAKPDEIALSVMLVTIIVLLMCTQIYGAWAVWCLAEKVNKAMRLTPIRPITTRTNSSTSTVVEDAQEKV